jgi:hypothetical protein
MGEFIYFTSLDHAKWFIDPESPCLEFTTKELDEHDGKRFDIKNWIESNCAGKVWMWNGVSSPSAGSMNWSNKIVPQGCGKFYFENDEDRILFSLTWK